MSIVSYLRCMVILEELHYLSTKPQMAYEIPQVFVCPSKMSTGKEIKIKLNNPDSVLYTKRIENHANALISEMRKLICTDENDTLDVAQDLYPKANLLKITFGNFITDPIDTKKLIQIYDNVELYEMYTTLGSKHRDSMIQCTFRTIDDSTTSASTYESLYMDSEDEGEEDRKCMKAYDESSIKSLDIESKPDFARDKKTQNEFARKVKFCRSSGAGRSLSVNEKKMVTSFCIQLDELIDHGMKTPEAKLLNADDQTIYLSITGLANNSMNISNVHLKMIYDGGIVKQMDLDFGNERLLVRFGAIPASTTLKRPRDQTGYLDEERFSKKVKE